MRNILVSAQLLLYAVFCPGFAESLICYTSMLANVIEREYIFPGILFLRILLPGILFLWHFGSGRIGMTETKDPVLRTSIL